MRCVVAPFIYLLYSLYDSEESERVSELKSISGSSRLPYGTLALGAEGIKNAIKTFDDAYALHPILFFSVHTGLTFMIMIDANRISKMNDCHLSMSANLLLLLMLFPAQVQI